MSGAVRPSYEFGPFRLDLSEHVLLRDGRPVPLTPKVFEVLCVLVQSSGHLIEKERLLKEVWPDSYVEEGALNRSVSVLRKALGEGSAAQKYIETVPKRGYRFVAPVIESSYASSTSIVRPSVPAAPRRGLSIRVAGGAGALLAVAAVSYAVLGRSESPRNAPTLGPAHRQVTFTGKEGDPSLSPDGRRIAYVSYGTPDKKVIVQELAGGLPLAVFGAPEVGHLRWSPDGSELLLWARGAGKDGVYIMPQLGGTPRRIAAGQFTACWSPDGSTIAVGSYLVGKIWFLNKLGREQGTLSLQGVHWSIWDIDWSPATGLLMFVSNDYQGRYSIWTIRPDGNDQRKQLSENIEIPSARWAPRGDAIYFFRRANQTDTLYKIPVQPGHENPTAVATSLITGLETDRSFAMSADGKRLAYARAPYHSNLWMLELRKNHKIATTQLTSGTSLIERPSVSPDGSSIVFNMGHEPLTNLYTMPITGGPPKQLTFLDSFSVAGVWSADGKSIAFASTQEGKPRVWAVHPGGGSPRALSSSELSDSFELAWAPGSQILYHQKGNRNYYQLDPATGSERLFVKDSSVGWIFSPVYSPDGRKIAVQWNRRPSRGIWVIDAHDRHETLVYKTSALSTMPIGWSADGSAIFAVEGKNSTYRGFTLPRGETITDAKILRIPLNGEDVQTVASLPFEEIGGVSMTPDGRRFVYTVYSSRSDVWVVDNFDTSGVQRVASRR
jgi:Tol biopolymer transport system component/DNA-binding winged helix-turn-helix (wHTH) protein